MSNEIKNLLSQIVIAAKLQNKNGEFVNYEGVLVDSFAKEIDSHLRSLVGEKGREALAQTISRWCNPLLFKHWDELTENSKDEYRSKADSLASIIGGIVAAREEAIRKEGRQESSDLFFQIEQTFPELRKAYWQNKDWLQLKKSWGIDPKEGE